MEWVQTWTIIGAIGALLGGMYLALRSEIKDNRNKIDKIMHYIARQEGFKEGVEYERTHHTAASNE